MNRITNLTRGHLVDHASALLQQGKGIEDGAQHLQEQYGITRERARQYMAKAMRLQRAERRGQCAGN